MAFVVNLGGEGEVPGALNQQPGPIWSRARVTSRNTNRTFGEEVDDGADFLLCPNDRLALPDGCVDTILTNWVPLFPCNAPAPTSHLGPVVQFTELERVLKPNGRWFHNGAPVAWTRGVPPILP